MFSVLYTHSITVTHTSARYHRLGPSVRSDKIVAGRVMKFVTPMGQVIG